MLLVDYEHTHLYNSYWGVSTMKIDKKQLIKEMGQRYYEARKAKGLTQEEAAEIADVTQQAISDAELGKSYLAPECMLSLCMAYEISTDYLLTGVLSDNDFLILDQRVRKLSPHAYMHYKGVSEHFLAAAIDESK